MTETKFTPGPWSVDRNVIRGDADQFGRTVAIASTLNVAWPYGRRATKEEPYNAHLIAAAPRMYAALDAMANGEGLPPGETIERILADARGES